LPKFGFHGNLFAPIKVQIAYLNSPIPKTLLFTRQIYRYLV